MKTRALSLSLLVLWLALALGCAGLSSLKGEPAAAQATAADAAAYPQPAPAPGAKVAGAPETWKRSQLVPNTSKLMVGDKESLPLSAMHVRATVEGFRARVVIDFHFANDTDRQLEGTFKMRLPDSASPYFFAFGETAVRASDTVPVVAQQKAQNMGHQPQQIMAARKQSWSGPKEARMVPREKAAMAYGNTVRRQIDPAIMDWAGAGVFNARVFPLAPNKQHRIVVGYDMDLTPVGGDFELAMDLPQDVPNLVVDVDVAQPKGGTVAVSPKVTGDSDDGRAFYRFANMAQEKTIKVRVTPPSRKALAISGHDAKTGPFFAANLAPKLPAASAGAGSDKAVLLLDTSLSSNPDAFNVWRSLTSALLENNRTHIKQFAVLFFNVEARWWRSRWTQNTAAEVSALLKDADELVLEGATDLGAALHRAANPSWDPGGRFPLFLLSDGAATWGESEHHTMARLLNGRRLFAYQTGLTGTDKQALDVLTRESGGAQFTVVGESEIAKASTAHNSLPWTLEAVDVSGASDVLVAGRPTSVFPGQRLTIAGRGAVDGGAQVTLSLSQGTTTKKVRMPLANALSTPLAVRAYGQIAVTQLEELGTPRASEATAYAMHFRVTGKTCSLLMLESEADYRSHGIEPEQTEQLVKSKLASELVEKAAGQMVLGDPKSMLESWIGKLETMDGVKLTNDAAFRKALRDMPASVFAVPSQPLKVSQPTKKATSKSYLSRLAKRKIDYDAVVAESERRRGKHGNADALKVLSTLVEHNPGDSVLARDVAIAADRLGHPNQAYHLLRRVADLDQQRVLVATAGAPGRPEVHQRHLAVQLRCLEARLWIGQARQVEGWHGLADQGRRHMARIAAGQQGLREQADQRDEDDDGAEADHAGCAALLVARSSASAPSAASARRFARMR